MFKADPATRDINFDWNELAKTVRLEVDQNKARALGVDSQLLGNTLQTLLSGVTVTQYRERTETIDVVARAVPAERLSVEGLEAINLRTGNGGVVSLAQLATLRFELEEAIIWRRNRAPTHHRARRCGRGRAGDRCHYSSGTAARSARCRIASWLPPRDRRQRESRAASRRPRSPRWCR